MTLIAQIHSQFLRWQRGFATDAALAQVDDRTLRDLGLDRSEIGSIAAEVEGRAERTRIRSLAI